MRINCRLIGTAMAIFGLFAGVSHAQHVHVSQVFAAPLNLNPAFSGLQTEASATVKYRQQWPQIQGTFQTLQAQADYRFKRTQNGIGLQLYQDQAGENALSRTEATASYAYHAELSSKWTLSAGMGAGFGLQKADISDLVFGDQLSSNGYLVSETQESPGNFGSKGYFSLNTGLILSGKNFWLSAAGFRLNRPDVSVESQKDPLAASFIFSSGYKFYLSEVWAREDYQEASLTPVALYYRQGPLEQFNLGLYGTFSPVHAGVVYKGVSLFGSKDYAEALALLLGVSLGKFSAAYSYDVPVSGIVRSAGGAHELSVVFENIDYNKIYRKRVRYKKYRHVPCPLF